MTKKITATEFARSLSDLLNRVRYGRESFLVERGGVEVCEVRPTGYATAFTGNDFADFLRSTPSPGAAFLEQVEEDLRNQGAAEDRRWNPK